MSKMNVHFSSNTDDWATPIEFFNKLNNEFNFNLDVCASHSNHKCENYFTIDDDGLSKNWKGSVWMNPPYGREISKWVEKAYKQSKEQKSTIVCLLPARVDTKWWHRFCMKGEIYFVPGRLKFGSAVTSAPFPSAVVVFRPNVVDAFGESNE